MSKLHKTESDHSHGVAKEALNSYLWNNKLHDFTRLLHVIVLGGQRCYGPIVG